MGKNGRKTGVRESFIVKGDRPEAFKEYAKTIARSSFFAGEPIREQKIVRSDSGLSVGDLASRNARDRHTSRG